MQYRFKTLEEFEKEFEKDEHGRYRTSDYSVFTPSMYPLAGTEIDDKLVEDIHRLKRTSLSFNGKSFSVIPEMITPVGLPEKWYIRGCDELRNYFKGIYTFWKGAGEIIGYYTEDNGVWNGEYIDKLDKDYKEITLEQYLKFKGKKMDKKIIGYKIAKEEYRDAAFKICGINPERFSPILNRDFDVDSTMHNMLKAVNVIDLWCEPVNEEEFSLPEIKGYSGTYKDGKLIFGCAKLNPEWFKADPEFNRDIVSITLDSGVVINSDQIKQIRKFLETN